MKIINILLLIVLFSFFSCGTTSNTKDIIPPPVEPINQKETIDEISQPKKIEPENIEEKKIEEKNIEPEKIQTEASHLEELQTEELQPEELDIQDSNDAIINNIIEPEITDEVKVENDYDTQPVEPKDSVFLEEFSSGLSVDTDLFISNIDSTTDKTGLENPTEVFEPEFHEVEEIKKTEEIISVPSGKKAVVKKVQRQTSSVDVMEKNETVAQETNKTNTTAVKPKKSNKTVKNSTIVEEPEVQFAVVDSSLEDNNDFNNLSAEKLLTEAEKLYKSKKYEKALQYLDKFFLISVSDFDRAWYLRGKIYEAFSDFTNIKKAKEAYETLVSLYPQSEFWDEAEERIAYINKFYFSIY